MAPGQVAGGKGLRRGGKGQENLGRAATGAEGSGRGKKKRSRGGVRGRVEWASVGTGDTTG